MAKSNNQKGKILYLERLLRDTGESRAVTMQEILAYLLAQGIHAERKSIYDDLEVLRSFGMDIRYRRGRPGGYYLQDGGVGSGGGQACTAQDSEQTGSFPENEGEQISSVPHGLALLDLLSPMPDDAPSRQVKLICEAEFRSHIERFWGDAASFQQKENGSFLVTFEVPDGPAFYGWLTAVGQGVHLLKPRKMQQTYRDYLKQIAREYKI